MEFEYLSEDNGYGLKTAPFMALRKESRVHCKRVRNENRCLRKKEFLKSQIEHNHNIFQKSDNKFSRKATQKIIWEKNYRLKMLINLLRGQNSATKAKMWNFQKENRKMDKQIESWNLGTLFAASHQKPYIDMATVHRVFGDQDYQITSNKIEIAELERILQDKQREIETLTKNIQTFDQCLPQLKHKLTGKREDLFHVQLLAHPFRVQEKHEELENSLAELECHKRLMIKNIELKRKMNHGLCAECDSIAKELSQFQTITEEDVESIKQETRKMKLEEQCLMKNLRKQLQRAQEETTQHQFEIQDSINEFIRKKIELNKSLHELAQAADRRGGLPFCG